MHLSQRSNGLALSQRHFLSASSPASSPRPAKRLHSTVLLQTDGNMQVGPRLKGPEISRRPDVLDVITSHPKLHHIHEIRSLIPPTPLRSQISTKAHRRKSSSASMKSFTSSMLSRKCRWAAKPTLITLPVEILALVLQHLSQVELHTVMLTHSTLLESAALFLYERPRFASTYRFAQFTTLVSHKSHYADMVRVLDVSHFGRPKNQEPEPMAGWREWKYRNESLYTLQRSKRAPSKHTSHPPPYRLLSPWCLSRDLPTGAIIHVLTACQYLRYVIRTMDCVLLNNLSVS